MACYRLGRALGFGAKSVVYEAWKLLPDGREKTVAIKRILAEHSDDETIRRILCREADICQRVNGSHPNLINVYELDEDQHGRPFLVLERIDGVTIERLGPKPLPTTVVRLLLRQLLVVLAHIHERGVVHRDISAKNVLVSLEGEVKLSDFGFASLRDVSSELGIRGTAPMSAPRRIRGSKKFDGNRWVLSHVG